MSQWRLSPLLCAAFVGGIMLLQHLPQLPPPMPLSLAAALLLTAAWRLPRRRRWLLPLAAALLGSTYANWRAHARLAEALPPALVWQDITIEGTVQGFPDINDQRTRFDFKIDKIDSNRPIALPLLARLSDYHRGDAPTPFIAAGNRLRFTARLRPPTSTVNPYGFDYAGYLLSRNIRLVGYIRDPDNAQLLDTATHHPRRRLYERIGDSGTAQHALIAALVIGDRSRISDEQWQVLRRTGTAHLVSVSGVHIGLIFLLATLCFGGLWRCSPWLIRRCPAAAAAILLALPVSLLYALLAGFAVPVQRSFLMSACAATVLFLGGSMSVFTAVLLAMLVVNLIDPWAVLAPGFWLSFALTATMLAAAAGGYDQGRLWWRLLMMQLVLSIIAIPLTLWFFNEASFASPLANIVAVPVVGFVVLPLALAGGLLGSWCWHIASALLDILWVYLHWLSELPYATWTPAQPPLWLFLLAIGGGLWLLMPRGVPWRISGLLPIIAMLLWQPPPLAAGTAQLVVLDVGQGTAVVLHTATETMVYDTGRALGGHIIADYLQARGVKTIDRLVISHNDDDHRGGMSILLSEMNADRIITPDGEQRCERGQQWRYDGITVRVLHPPPAHTLPINDNDNSCVLHIQNASGKSALLTGDISAGVEKRLATAADVLLVAHHGSRSSSHPAFLRQVGADIAVIPVGRNGYGHPHPQTLQRLQRAGAAVYRTDTDGAIILQLTDTIQATRWRDEDKRYWR